jgi:hypothetical protein
LISLFLTCGYNGLEGIVRFYALFFSTYDTVVGKVKSKEDAMLRNSIERIAKEPPFRIVARAILKKLNLSTHTRSIWEISKRPQYLIGLVEAARQAIQQGRSEISVIEFGVAGGDGLVVLQEEAALVESETAIKINVYGFDMGVEGLPSFIGDYRDHPDAWMPGDYKMDVEKLKARLTDRTKLVLGNVKNTVSSFFEIYNPPPIGFVSFDLDLYSSTKDALSIFHSPGLEMLWNTPLYFDDIQFIFNHKFAGELLAIREFNEESENIKIDRWYGIEYGRPFPERYIYKKLFVAHDLLSISKATLSRDEAKLDLG